MWNFSKAGKQVTVRIKDGKAFDDNQNVVVAVHTQNSTYKLLDKADVRPDAPLHIVPRMFRRGSHEDAVHLIGDAYNRHGHADGLVTTSAIKFLELQNSKLIAPSRVEGFPPVLYGTFTRFKPA